MDLMSWFRRRATRPEDLYAGYAATVFFDANIVLEGKPFAELPWGEIDGKGPILVLFLPQVLREIDDKKRDPRLGVIARAFSRSISPATELGNPPVTLVPGPLRVDATLAICSRIPWDQYDDFDPGEGDSRIVAELLHTKSPPLARRVLVSADINPVAKASRRGLKALHASSTWLRPREMSKAERELQSIRQKQAERDSAAPKLRVTFAIAHDEPIETLLVAPLQPEQRTELCDRIVKLNPKRSQTSNDRFSPMSLGIGLDHTLDKRYTRYVNQTVPAFIRDLPKNLEREYGQFGFSIEIENVGQQPARGLVADIRFEGGWMNDRFVIPRSRFPLSPYPRDSSHFLNMPRIEPIPRLPTLHEFHFSEEPAKSAMAVVRCADFRHGTRWTFYGVAWADPRATGTFRFRVELDADSLDAPLVFEREVKVEISHVQCEDLIDLNSGRRVRDSRVDPKLRAAHEANRLDELEIESDESED